MRLFVMRHGEAELMANSDKERHLNANGKEQALMQGTWLKSTALSFIGLNNLPSSAANAARQIECAYVPLLC